MMAVEMAAACVPLRVPKGELSERWRLTRLTSAPSGTGEIRESCHGLTARPAPNGWPGPIQKLYLKQVSSQHSYYLDSTVTSAQCPIHKVDLRLTQTNESSGQLTIVSENGREDEVFYGDNRPALGVRRLPFTMLS
ncbi:hypothetical protein SKAU_G00046020 [Synaphobranchus kaupii]|uniref:Uncharacterized protein n=1 Tax=Synaphobranchus kaupii TaxID=118154 RepID=A0A9Q1G310_SYNKA|nr:hypothetical protein SKAU_G00046020 [Synaphobranchus kaupii]